MPELKIRSDWPFPIERSPVFYGWVIWLVSSIGFVMSIPGQTMGMAVFTDHFIEAFGLSRTELSLAYLFGTLGSSFFLTRAGRFYDETGARISIVASSIGLGLFIIFIACIERVAQVVSHITATTPTLIAFPLILFGYFGVRFAGQGVLTSSSRNVLLVWFEKRRGLVVGTRSVFITLGFSLAPPFLAFLITYFGWRGALFALAAIVGVMFSLTALVFIRDTPESCGLLPDGQALGDLGAAPSIPSLTLAETKKSPVFWIYTLVLAFYSLFGTAFIFHIVAIFAEAGRSSAEAFAYFFPLALVSVSVNLSSSWLSDRIRLKNLLVVKLMAFILGAWGLLHLHEQSGYWIMVAGFGTCGGIWGALSNLAYIRFFGRQHLGQISGLSMSLVVFGSAIGPALFSLGYDLFDTYHVAVWLNLAVLIVLLIATIIIPQDEPIPLVQNQNEDLSLP